MTGKNKKDYPAYRRQALQSGLGNFDLCMADANSTPIWADTGLVAKACVV